MAITLRTTAGRLAGPVLLAWVCAAAASPLDQHIALCVACHGPGGNSVIPDNPKLAGMDADYLLRQLTHFKSGKRTSSVMSQIVTTIDDASFQDLAAYFSEQKRAPGVVADAALAERGRVLFTQGLAASGVPACASCHGSDGLGDAKYPRLAAQQPAYVEKQLRAFRSGERANDLKGAMGDVARRLSDDDIRAAAQFVAGLKED